MTDFQIRIIIDTATATRGVRQVDKSLSGLARTAKNVRNIVATVFAARLGGQLVGELIQITDKYQNLQNRLNAVRRENENVAQTTQELLQVANNARSALESVGTIYGRLALSAKTLGLNQKELISFTESLTKTIEISGASAYEAQGALVQFSQAMASGALRGDELRSVLEQFPEVARVIAKEFGVTAPQLAKLGETGAITSDRIIKAFRDARQEIEERFGRTIPTIAQSMNILKNNLLVTFGEFNKAAGISDILAKGIRYVADNIASLIEFTRNFLLIATTGLAVLTLKAIPALVTALGRLVATNPFIALTVALTVLVQKIPALRQKMSDIVDALSLVLGGLERLKKELADEAALSKAGAQLVQYRKQLRLATEQLELAQKRYGANSVEAANLARVVAYLADKERELVKQIRGEAAARAVRARAAEDDKKARQAEEAQLARIQKLVDEIRKPYREYRQATIDLALAQQQGRITATEYEEALSKLRDPRLAEGVETQAEAFRRIQAPLREYTAKLNNANALLADQIITLSQYNNELQRIEGLETQAEALQRIKQPQKDFENGMKNLAALQQEGKLTAAEYAAELERLRPTIEAIAQADPYTNQLESIKQGVQIERKRLQYGQLAAEQLAARLQLQQQGRKLTESESKQLDLVIAKRQQLAGLANLAEQLNWRQQLIDKEQQLNQLLLDRPDLTREINAALNQNRLAALEASTSFADGFERAYERAKQAANDYSQTSEAIFNQFVDKSSEALSAFLLKGEDRWKEFAQSAVQEITKIIVKMLILKAIEAGLGAAGFGGSTVTSIVAGERAEGGPVSSGKTYLVGEEGPELFTPGKSGSVTPNDALVAPAPQTNLQVVNVTDPRMVPEAIADGESDDAIVNVIGRRASDIRQLLG